MKAVQNFLVRTKVYFAKEQTRQVEFFQKRMNNQHNHQNNVNNGQATHHGGNKIVFLSRQRANQLRPFQKFFLSVNIIHQVRIAHLYNTMNGEEDYLGRMRRLLFESEDSLRKSYEDKLPDQNMEGILEIFNNPASGCKEFCGKQIDLNFQHVIETHFPFMSSSYNNEDVMSVAHSQYIDDDFGPQAYLPVAANIERIRQGEDLLELSDVYSENDLSEYEGFNNQLLFTSYLYEQSE